MLVDAVGVYGSAQTDDPPLEREPRVPLKKVLDDIALGRWRRNPNLLPTLLSRLSRLNRRLQKPGMGRVAETLRQLNNGQDLHSIIQDLDRALDPDERLQEAQAATGQQEPSAVAQQEAIQRLISRAVEPFDKPELREALLNIQARDEQVIDTVSKDTVLVSSWDTQAREAAEQTITSFRQFIETHKDEITALQIFYSQPHRKRLTEDDVTQLVQAIAAPPLGLTTDKLWQAYETLRPNRVKKRSNKHALTDLVSLLRYTMVQDTDEDATLEPYRETIERRFDIWLNEQEQRRGKPFSDEQRQWLVYMRDTIATSLTIERDDFEYGELFKHGGLGRASEVFGNDFAMILRELNERLAA